jgi:hypothetical protein
VVRVAEREARVGRGGGAVGESMEEGVRVRSRWRRRRPAVVMRASTGRSGEKGILTDRGRRGQ